jgi:ribosomal protein L37E
MFDRFRNLLQRKRTRTIHECRRCGRTLDEPTGACSDCGWAGVAIYEIEE